MKHKLVVMLVVLAFALPLSAQSSQCLIVRSAEGHRFRNSMIAGALTGGIGFAAGESSAPGLPVMSSQPDGLGVPGPPPLPLPG